MADNPILDIFAVDVPCPHCGENDLKIIRELIDNKTIACSFCNAEIDLSTEAWQAFIKETVDTLGHIHTLPPS